MSHDAPPLLSLDKDQGFPTSALLMFLGWIILCCLSVLCTVGCLAASQVSVSLDARDILPTLQVVDTPKHL